MQWSHSLSSFRLRLSADAVLISPSNIVTATSNYIVKWNWTSVKPDRPAEQQPLTQASVWLTGCLYFDTVLWHSCNSVSDHIVDVLAVHCKNVNSLVTQHCLSKYRSGSCAWLQINHPAGLSYRKSTGYFFILFLKYKKTPSFFLIFRNW